jgi:hypothetical protein
MQAQIGISRIKFSTEQRLCFQPVEAGLDVFQPGPDFLEGGLTLGLIFLLVRQFEHDFRIFQRGRQLVERSNHRTDGIGLGNGFTGAVLVIPEIGLRGLKFQFFQFFTFGPDVKDTPASLLRLFQIPANMHSIHQSSWTPVFFGKRICYPPLRSIATHNDSVTWMV